MIDIQEIPPERIDYHSPNVRRVLDETGSLAQSMEAHGQLEPGTGWWDEDRFRIATGHRRAQACRHLGIPFLARIIPPLTGTDLIEYQLVENVQAESLAPEDLENAVGALMDRYGSPAEVGRKIGKSPQWVGTINEARAARQSLAGSRPSAAGPQAAEPNLSTSAMSRFAQLKDEENRRAAFEEARRRSKGGENLPGRLVNEVVEEYRENEIRDVPAYIHKLEVERAKLVKRRSDIEDEIDRIDARIARLRERSGS